MTTSMAWLALEALVGNGPWSEMHRARSAEAGYKLRELLNPGGKPVTFTANEAFMQNFSRRTLDSAVLTLQHQTCIYNDTVAIYNWRDDQKVGLEIHNAAYAQMMRQVFEQYWRLAH